MVTNRSVTLNLGGPLWLLAILFIVLKLTGAIDWSWWLATLPIWGGLALAFAWFLLLFLWFLLVLLVVAVGAAASGTPRPKITFTKKGG